MTKYRIVEQRCPKSTTFYIEYKALFIWHRVQDINRNVCQDYYLSAEWPTLEAARYWIAVKQAAQRPCVTIIHQP